MTCILPVLKKENVSSKIKKRTLVLVEGGEPINE